MKGRPTLQVFSSNLYHHSPILVLVHLARKKTQILERSYLDMIKMGRELYLSSVKPIAKNDPAVKAVMQSHFDDILEIMRGKPQTKA